MEQTINNNEKCVICGEEGTHLVEAKYKTGIELEALCDVHKKTDDTIRENKRA